MDIDVEPVNAADPVLETVLHWHWREWSLGTEVEREEWGKRLRSRTGETGIPFTLVADGARIPSALSLFAWTTLTSSSLTGVPGSRASMYSAQRVTSAWAADSSTGPPNASLSNTMSSAPT